MSDQEYEGCGYKPKDHQAPMSKKIEIKEEDLDKLIAAIDALTKEVASLASKQVNPIQYVYHYPAATPSYPVYVNPYPNYPPINPFITTCGAAVGVTTYTG